MDNAAVIALATALEIEFEDLRYQLEGLAEVPDAKQFEEKINNLINYLPHSLAALAAVPYSKSVVASILATHYLEGVAHASKAAIRNTGKLMPLERAMDAIAESRALVGAANPLRSTKAAFEVRANATAKVIKGQIIQDLRATLKGTDKMRLPQAQEVVATAAKDLGDLVTNKRVKHHVEALQDLAKGYGVFTVHQNEGYLRSVPFQEFYRVEHRTEWRDWPKRWQEQGGKFYPGASDYPEGRMIAETNSKIWEDLSNPSIYSDATGSPYPPFAWNSGMGVRAVPLNEVRKLGLLGRHNVPIKPKKLDFNAGVSFSVDLDDDIKSALVESLQDWDFKNNEKPELRIGT
jgi:hypothetical protein